ncbi:MAG TPA: hypothetical protein VM030_08825 [Acidimicrobiales bacterium]|nr:hypothetical protein [Acidimicrobiales bacterium]
MDHRLIGVLVAVAGAYGVYLLYSALALGWTGLGVGPGRAPRGHRFRPVGLHRILAITAAGGAGMVLALVTFGGLLPALVAGGFAASAPSALARATRQQRQATAREAWPRLIEEIRLQTGSLGRSVPQALFDVGRRGPLLLRPHFAAAEREWRVTTDFERTMNVLKSRLADPTADATCETLLVAHQIGGGDLDRRLAALAEDRVQDLQGRKDARAKQAGVRFARRFVLVVPAGMAMAGLSIGTGRSAYATPLGQTAVALGLSCVVACWLWAGALMRLPDDDRVFE